MVNPFVDPLAGLAQPVSAAASTKEELCAFAAVPSAFCYDVTRARTVALVIERGNTARFPQC